MSISTTTFVSVLFMSISKPPERPNSLLGTGAVGRDPRFSLGGIISAALLNLLSLAYILYYTILYYTILYHTIPYCTILDY